MADEAFALSPISARPVMPNDADYDAIREAFMETSRGRWFLAEYAKRNRNADTRMVLDAVARIEQNIATQKQAGGPSLSETLVAIRAVVGEARAGVAKAIVGLENDAVLAAAHDGARIIREVSWTLRECGADIRICNLLDSQLVAIDAGHRLVTEIDLNAVASAFDGLLDRIHDLAGEPRSAAAAPVSPDQDETPSPIADGEMPEAAMASQPEAAMAPAKPEPEPEPSAASEPAAPEMAAEAGVLIVTATETDDIEFVEPEETPATGVAAAQPAPAAAAAPAFEEPPADVDAMLDLVAMEMAAPQPPEPGELEAAVAAAQAEAELAEASLLAAEQAEIERLAAEVAVAHEPAPPSDVPSIDVSRLEIGERGELLDTPIHLAEPVMTAPAMSQSVAAAPTMAAISDTAPAMASAEASASTSLGAALLASGVVGQPAQPRSDALAPLRRMSQAEKVAFFS
ncbi:MAG: hypothetical protein HZA66_21025 [Rhodopseudomonas palustris]|uniref:Uncharacterized protein n=1 Tax=Rhodopseudomonas palustris TaxID=1076 RepID=A0A933VXD1_RHOPL|nr:hypothetical protein [Rhodopseudomonas palustris]